MAFCHDRAMNIAGSRHCTRISPTHAIAQAAESFRLPPAGIEWVFDGWEIGVKGDRVEIVIDVGGGTKTYGVTATRAGRRVDVATRRGLVEVSEVTRTGTPVRTARFMASRIVALVEYPASDHSGGAGGD